MGADSAARAIERHLSEVRAGENSDRYVDLQLDLIECAGITRAEGRAKVIEGQHLIRAGGKWDRLERRYVGDAAPTRRIYYTAAQRSACEWFSAWIARWWQHAFGDCRIPVEERIFSLLLSGGVRGGKTYLAVLMAVVYAIMVPGSIVWIVSPSRDSHFGEVESLLAEIMPKVWYRRLGAPNFIYSMVNGSDIVLKTAHDPGSLKDGDADFVVLNEAQLCSEKAWNILRLRIAKMGALAVLCANPPDKAIGMWVADRIADAEHGEIQAVHFHVDPEDNPFIDHATMHAFRAEVDQRTYDIEVRGLILGPEDAVFYNWSRLNNELPTPADADDCTRRFLRLKEHRDELDSIIGCDFQKMPHMVAVEYRCFWNPRLERDAEDWAEWIYLWAVREWVLPQANEEDLALALLDSGVNPERALLVCDASGQYQFAERNKELIREREWKGRGSWSVLQGYGFRHIVNPDREQERNPDVVERFRTATSRIEKAAETKYGRHFLFADPKACPHTCEAFRKYPLRHGVPHRTHRLAHNADAATYPIVRFYKRRHIRKDLGIKVIKHVSRQWDELDQDRLLRAEPERRKVRKRRQLDSW